MLKHALLYANFGWAVFPISQNSKIPYKGTHGCKDASKNEDIVTEMFHKYPSSNIGVATGMHSGFFVLDIDNKDGGSGEIALADLEKKYGKLPETVEQFTPSGGRHLLFKCPIGVRISNSTNNLGRYLDVRGDGGYILVAPSIIDSKDYCWEVAHNPFTYEIADAPEWLLGLVQETRRDYDINLSEKDRIIKEGVRDERLFEIAKVARGSGLTDQGSLFAYLQGVNQNNCRPPLLEATVMKIVNSVLSYEDKKAEAVINGSVLIWDRMEGGAFRTTYRNCLNFLNTEKNLAGLFKFNEFAKKTYLTKRPIWVSYWNGVRPVNDDDILMVKQILTTLNFQPTIGLLTEAIQTVASNNSYHPVRDYLNSLKWDGVNRVENFLSTYFNSANTPYTQFTSKMMLCAAVKRVFYPGIKYDYMIILEGDQDIGKSRGLRALGGEWFSEVTLTERDKDLIDKMQGQWIIEVPEMQVFKKKDVEALKNFLSTQIDRVRMAYAHYTSEFPRQCIFIGSINPNGLGYFQDETGNRRFFPVTCGNVDVKGIEDNRDMLFAEAVELAKTFELMIPKDINKDAIMEQELRLASDEWDHYIIRWLEDPIKTTGEGITISDVWTHALNGQMDRLGRIEQLRISKILKKLGFTQRLKCIDGKTHRVYSKIEAPIQEAVWTE